VQGPEFKPYYRQKKKNKKEKKKQEVCLTGHKRQRRKVKQHIMREAAWQC
jgi:hypothetical protein